MSQTAAAVNAHGARGATDVIDGLELQIEPSRSDDDTSLNTNTNSTSKIVNQSISKKAYEWKLVSSLNLTIFQEQIYPIVTKLVDTLPKSHAFYLIWQQGAKANFH
jgi:hypothetical protein